jgi:hypothetical protein
LFRFQIFSSTTHPADVEIIATRIAANSGINLTDGQDTRIVHQSCDNGVRLKLENNKFEWELLS